VAAAAEEVDAGEEGEGGGGDGGPEERRWLTRDRFRIESKEPM
jgi:hypothetical protein